MTRLVKRLTPMLAALALPMATALASVPYPSVQTPRSMDVGALSAVEGNRAVTVTVALNLHDGAGAAKAIEGIYDPKSAQFHHFLTPAQFREQFAPTADEVARVSSSLQRFGLTVVRASSTTLRVTGTPGQLEKAFTVSLHEFEVPAHGSTPGYHYRAPLSHPVVPSEVAPLVAGVFGLSTRPHFIPHSHPLPETLRHAAAPKPTTSSTTGNPFGVLTVADFAANYNVNPLYAQGITGAGRTLGIVTLASFTPSDAFAYWSAVGLTVDPNRISVVNIDGGAGAPNDAAGSGETTLDVEQSGGVAPGAKIIVYVAPNTSQAFVDALAQAVDDNTAETVSTSWGEWEWFDDYENSPVSDPSNPNRTISTLTAYHHIFIQAALQGQSLFASSGDSGAYDVNNGTDSNNVPLLPPYYSLALSVDSPASDPYITAAGGTTLAGTQQYLVNGSVLTIDIKHEQVWSWTYLNGLCADLGLTPIACGTFPVGSGGGVSIFYPTPSYQWFLPGVQTSQPHQAFVDYTVTPSQVIDKLPGNYAGRNLPDVSANADPETGYVIFYTSSSNGFGYLTYYGGTSFVAPQMNGVTALYGQYIHGRVGLLNYPLYFISRFDGLFGGASPVKPIRFGDNDFYTGSNGYNPAAGVGILDVASFARALRELYGY